MVEVFGVNFTSIDLLKVLAATQIVAIVAFAFFVLYVATEEPELRPFCLVLIIICFALMAVSI